LPLDYLIEFPFSSVMIEQAGDHHPFIPSQRMFLYLGRRQIMMHIHGDVASTNQSTTCHASTTLIRFLTALSTTGLLGWMEDFHILLTLVLGQ
jgi:hypothetical protein